MGYGKKKGEKEKREIRNRNEYNRTYPIRPSPPQYQNKLKLQGVEMSLCQSTAAAALERSAAVKPQFHMINHAWETGNRLF
jgi:predicted peroxiredoxin